MPTITLGVLYCFFVIGHDRRKILRFNVTRNPNAMWIVQQMREAWPYQPVQKFLLFDRDSKFGNDVVSFVRDMGIRPARTAFRSPWQNELRSVGWEVADETCWITSSCSMSGILNGSWPSTCATTTRTGRIWGSRKTHQQVGLLHCVL